MFAPLFLEKYAGEAVIQSPDGTNRPLVSDTRTIMPYNAMEESAGFPVPPTGVFGVMLVITILLCIIGIRRRKIFWGWELLLMVIQGAAGCVYVPVLRTSYGKYELADCDPEPYTYYICSIPSEEHHEAQIRCLCTCGVCSANLVFDSHAFHSSKFQCFNLLFYTIFVPAFRNRCIFAAQITC